MLIQLVASGRCCGYQFFLWIERGFCRAGVEEAWKGFNGPLFCDLYPSPWPNINQSGYATVQQITLSSTTSNNFELTVINSNNQNVYSHSQSCSYPSGTGPIDYFAQEEGIVVGGAGGGHASFSPFSSTIFYGYIDMVSNFNKMSSSSQTIQTGETSNLYQSVTQTVSQGYGSSMYLYSVMSDEITKTGT